MNNLRRRVGKPSKIVVDGVTYLDFGLPSGTYFASGPHCVYETWSNARSHNFTIASKAQFEELIAACNLSFHSEGSGSQEKHYVIFTSKTTGAKATVYMHGYKARSGSTPAFLNASSYLWSNRSNGTNDAYFMFVQGQDASDLRASIEVLDKQCLCGYWRVYKP